MVVFQMTVSSSKNCLEHDSLSRFHQILRRVAGAGADFKGSKMIIYFRHLPISQVYNRDFETVTFTY
jgi:hypothetical protein